MIQRLERQFAGRTLSLEVGRMAKLAQGSCLVQYGDTVVLCAVTVQDRFEDCVVAGTITNPYGVENDLRDPPNIFVCRNPRLPWDQLWGKFKRYS